MKFELFIKSLEADQPDEKMPDTLRVLWFHRKQQWEKAHQIAQDMEGPDGAWLHAFLHRDEGDEWNAGYWYRRAGKPFFNGAIAEEWEKLARQFCN